VRIAHITSSISRIGAGVSKVVRDLAEAQANNADAIQIFTLLDQFTHIDQPDHNGITITACPVTLLPRFGYSFLLQKSLSEHAGSMDIIHMHGLWMYPNWAAGKVARKSTIPYIMSPHGMLEPWGLDRSRWKKKITGLLFEHNNLANALCLHACSEQEAQNFRNFGYKGPIALIPLGLTREEFNIAYTATSKHVVDISQLSLFADKNVLLFLSRLHVKKGLEFLLDAWGSIESDFSDWHLVIAGEGEPAYVAELQRKVSEAGITESVTFMGPVHGDDKWGLMKKANIFVLPTYSENFGLVIAEALACGVPVITTKGTPWSDLETEECGWWIDIGAKPLADCLVDALSLPDSWLTEMGERGRRLVEAKYMIDLTARTMHGVYEWMLGGGPVPDCVRLDR
jgi:glycosyltransferase involved in cell wall biosynthesis